MNLKREREKTDQVDEDQIVGLMLNEVTLERKKLTRQEKFVYELNVSGNTALFHDIHFAVSAFLANGVRAKGSISSTTHHIQLLNGILLFWFQTTSETKPYSTKATLERIVDHFRNPQVFNVRKKRPEL